MPKQTIHEPIHVLTAAFSHTVQVGQQFNTLLIHNN